MDKPIDPTLKARRKRNSILIGAAVIIIAIVCLGALRTYIKPSISRSAFTTSVAEKGDIENSLNAMGEILPEFEEVLTSPINAAIVNVHHDPGTRIRSGQSILELDKSIAETEFQKLGYEIELKQHEIAKLKLDLNKSFYDVNSNNDIKELRIRNLKDAVSNAARLYKAGGGTREDIESAELDLKVAVLEKQQLENEIKNKQQTMKIEIREAELALDIHQSDYLALKRKLELANVVATRNGVITWVNRNIGASVREGDAVARIANLSSYKVSGSISDTQVDALNVNMPAIVRVNDMQLRGHVSNISPAVNNATVSFEVQLDDKSNKVLRPNLKVDLFLITERRNGVIRVANGAAFRESKAPYVFVIKGGKAVRRSIQTGISNFDHVEILSGINAGETVITSDMKAYEHAKEIVIEQ